MAPILLEKHGHAGIGDPADVRKPAQEFYMVPYPPMAHNANDDIGARPKGALPTQQNYEYGWANARMPAREGRKAPITKNQPLHVDGYAEQKRRDLELYRGINEGMGVSAATWLRGRGEHGPQLKAHFRSAGGNWQPRTAKGELQNLKPGQTRPHSAAVAGRGVLYTGQGSDDRGRIIKLSEGEGGGLRKDVLESVPKWDGLAAPWPEPNNTEWPVVQRLKPANYVDGLGERLLERNGLRAMFDMKDRRGNREEARKMGEGGLFRGKDGEWLKRMWKIKAWSEPGGGIHGGMSKAGTNCSDKHHPVGDGWAPPRQLADGWGAKKWPMKGSHYVRKAGGRGVGDSNQEKLVTHFGRAPAKKGTPQKLKPGCWRGGCKFPHGEDAKDDLMHGLPVSGVSKTLRTGRFCLYARAWVRVVCAFRAFERPFVRVSAGFVCMRVCVCMCACFVSVCMCVCVCTRATRARVHTHTHTHSLTTRACAHTRTRRTMKNHAPPKRRSWIATARPKSAAPDFNPSPWAGYAACNPYF